MDKSLGKPTTRDGGAETVTDFWIDIKSAMVSATGVPAQLLSKFHSKFRADSQLVLAMNAICRSDMNNVLVRRDVPVDTYHVYSERLEQEVKATNQKASGRCWLFAALNTLRPQMMKKYKLDEFEFSQSYLFWCDKLEKSNWFLENVLNTLDEDLDGRLVQFLLANPVQDGGQWDMVVNLVEKYGLLPKSVFPESPHSNSSRQLVWLLTAKLREYACRLRREHESGMSMDELRSIKESMLEEVYRILSIALGEPPAVFSWSFRDKDKRFNTFPNLTAVEFYRDQVGVDIAQKYSLIHDPRHEYFKLYTVEYLGNVVGGRPILYINLPIEELKKYAATSIQNGTPVWFGCDVGKFSHRQLGILDLGLFDYCNAYKIDFGLTKAERLRYGESAMTHAMVLSGVHLEAKGGEEKKPVRWRVENSWGEDGGEKGYFSMTDDWFSEYVYQIVVDKANLTGEICAILEQTPVWLPPWDPFGALA